MSNKKKSTRKSSAKTTSLKVKKGAWFVPVRWSYLPVSAQGVALYVPYTMFLVLVMLVATRQDTAAEGVVIVVPCFVAAGAVMQWIASHKS
jgi:hypothetical protein